MDKELAKAIDNIQARMFYMNKRSDRVASLLKNKFLCVVFADIFHNDFAHFWALRAADKLVELKDLSGVSSEYPSVEGSIEDYESIEEMFRALYDATEETKEAVFEVVDLAEKVRDIYIKCALENYLIGLQKVVHSAEVMSLKAAQYGRDVTNFDIQAQVWYIPIFTALDSEDDEDAAEAR